MKILIIRFSSIGDIVLTTPVIRCLKLQLGAEIHYLTKKSFQGILTSNPHIDKVYTIEKQVTGILPNLKKENYDYIIDLHKNHQQTILLVTHDPHIAALADRTIHLDDGLIV